MPKIGNIKIEYRPVGKLKPMAKNARAHPPEQIDAMKRAIERWGFYAPLLVDSKKGVILKGNGSFQAALQLEMRTVPCVEVSGLTQAELRALAIWDNRSAEKSGWDKDLLAAEMLELKGMGFDLTLTGFDAGEIEELLKPSPSAEPEPATPALPKHAVSKPGDVWLLGEHRVICGDSTKAATLKALMHGRKAQCVFTDPPYGISYEAPSGSFEVIKGDDVWEVSRDNGHGKATTTHHPTQKPVELARRAIRNSTLEGEIVLDLFAGSGSTLIGAQDTKRIAYVAELDPRYVDVNVRRWQDLTGKQATHGTEKKTFDAIAKARAGRKASG